MSKSSGSSDLDKTDELPVLSEEAIVAAGGEYPEFARGQPDDPAVHGQPVDAELDDEDPAATSRLPAPHIDDPTSAPAAAEPRRAGTSDDGARPESGIDAVATLGRDIAAITARWSGLEAVLENNAAVIAALQKELAASRRELSASNTRHQTLLTELAHGNARSSELDSAIEDAQADASARAGELEREQTRARKLGESLAEAGTRIASLESSLAETHSRVNALESELAATDKRSRDLEAARAAAHARAGELEGELAELTQALEAARAAAARKPDEDVLQPFHDRIASLESYIAGRNDRWAEMERLVASQRERIVELEREVAHRSAREQRLEQRIQDDSRLAEELRAQVAELAAASAAEARAEEARVPSAISDTASTPGPELNAALRAAQEELDLAREELARLERKLAQDPLLESDETPDETPDATVVPIMPSRPSAETVEAFKAPVLVCLTSEEPVRYVLDREETRIGRGPDCEIRIPTHFVSREHAGLIRENGQIVIEDRRSTNGVFVNAVRVDRKKLEDGDWVTIGETQFRYLSEGN